MVIFLCPYIGFPYGTAPTGRLTGYAKGLTELGKEVYILLPETSENGDTVVNCQIKGNIDGIHFEYTCGTTVRPKSFLKRRLLTIKGMARATVRLLQLMSRGKAEALVVYPDYLIPTLWFWLVSRLARIPFLLEKSEHPFFLAGEKPKSKMYQFLYTRLALRRFDGVMVISNYLHNYLRDILRSDTQFIKIPIFVDFDSFDGCDDTISSTNRYITYCGLLNEAKDGVLTLMKAFEEIYRYFPDVILRLVGDSHRGTKIPEFRGYAEELGISDRVEFIGMVRRDKIPLYLKQSTILALARPSSLQAQAGFPSKVGEYLASGIPAVITRTGELSEYLKDGVSVFFSEPDNYLDFSEKLRYVLSHPDEAHLVGLEGKAVARENFDYRVSMHRFSEFIGRFA
jgi:glycosyltransferase involved in cell wall biosynthesis